jgi:hypothetical protein
MFRCCLLFSIYYFDIVVTTDLEKDLFLDAKVLNYIVYLESTLPLPAVQPVSSAFP